MNFKQFSYYSEGLQLVVVIHHASTILQEWRAVRIKDPKLSPEDFRCLLWHKPPPSHIKINVDAGVGMVVRDEEGGFLMGRSLVSQGLMEVDEGEAWGVLEVMSWGESWVTINNPNYYMSEVRRNANIVACGS
ncbi:hypothetical protein ACS0TY_020329 [Phlomoides rotata]